MLIPREHGAWGMIYTPFLVTCIVLDQFDDRALLLFVALTAVFFAHEPLVILARLKKEAAGAEERSLQALLWLGIYLSVAVGASIPLLFRYDLWLLLPFGGIMMCLLMLHFRLMTRKTERSIPGELVGIASLTSTALAASYVLTGHLDSRGMLLWGLNFLYFVSSIFYVKMLVNRFSKKGKPESAIRLCIYYHTGLVLFLGLIAYWEWIPRIAFIAFVPVILRAIWGIRVQGIRLNLRKIGFAEFGFTLLFMLLLAITLQE